MPFTLIPCRPTSTARHVVKCATAAFMAPYTGSRGNPRIPSTEWTLTMLPVPASIIAGRNARVTAKTCRRLMSYIRCQVSAEDSSNATIGR